MKIKQKHLLYSLDKKGRIQEEVPDLRPITRDCLRDKLKGLKSEMLMWMIDVFIGFCTLIF